MAALPQFGLRSVRKTCDFSPSRPCLDTLYGPFYFADPTPAIAGRTELLFTMGGHVDDPQTTELSSPGRFADKIYYSYRGVAGGTWSSPELIIAKSFFPWMGSDGFLTAHPEAFVASVAGPSVVKIDSTYHMLFAATVSDPNVCTGEHPVTPNVHGSCLTPWSYFVLYWATSNDGHAWTLRNMHRQNANVALQYAALYYTPSQAETGSGSFKGLGMTHGAIVIGGTLYLFFEFWSSVGLRNGIARTSDMQQFEVWDGGTWEPIDDGVLPTWMNQDVWKGNPYAHVINQVTRVGQVPGYQFLLTAQGAGANQGGTGINNCIEYAASNDLLTWTPGQIVASAIAHVADGTGADDTVLNPVYYEDASGYHFVFASNDYNLDGQPDCNGPYPGLAIMLGDQTPPPQSVVADGATGERRRPAGEPSDSEPTNA